MRQDDFEAFFEARQRALLERIGRVMGKQLIIEDYSDNSANDHVEPLAAPSSLSRHHDLATAGGLWLLTDQRARLCENNKAPAA